jgi:hypothetical protein
MEIEKRISKIHNADKPKMTCALHRKICKKVIIVNFSVDFIKYNITIEQKNAKKLYSKP